jgi:hypothetical protein
MRLVLMSVKLALLSSTTEIRYICREFLRPVQHSERGQGAVHADMRLLLRKLPPPPQINTECPCPVSGVACNAQASTPVQCRLRSNDLSALQCAKEANERAGAARRKSTENGRFARQQIGCPSRRPLGTCPLPRSARRSRENGGPTRASLLNNAVALPKSPAVPPTWPG